MDWAVVVLGRAQRVMQTLCEGPELYLLYERSWYKSLDESPTGTECYLARATIAVRSMFRLRRFLVNGAPYM